MSQCTHTENGVRCGLRPDHSGPHQFSDSTERGVRVVSDGNEKTMCNAVHPQSTALDMVRCLRLAGHPHVHVGGGFSWHDGDEPMCDAWTLGGTCSLGQTHTEYVSHGDEPQPRFATSPDGKYACARLHPHEGVMHTNDLDARTARFTWTDDGRMFGPDGPVNQCVHTWHGARCVMGDGHDGDHQADHHHGHVWTGTDPLSWEQRIENLAATTASNTQVAAHGRMINALNERIDALEKQLSPPTVVAKPTCTARLYLQPRGSAGEDACVLPAGHDSVHCDKDGYRWNISYE